MRILTVSIALAVAGVATAQLAPRWTASGNVEGQIFGDTDPNFTGNYTVAVTGMPAGAIVQRAFVYGNEWNMNSTATMSINGNSQGPTSPYWSDNGLDAFFWDVTPFVLGNGNYNITIQGPLQNNGVALAVVYMHPSLPSSMVMLSDGAWNLGDNGPEQQSTTFGGFPGGTGTLSVYTQGDDNQATGEQVSFNGTVVGGPLDGNLGTHASILNIPVSVLAGTNTAAVSTGQDQLGWQVAMLNNPVPEPASLLALSLGALLVSRRLRRQ